MFIQSGRLLRACSITLVAAAALLAAAHAGAQSDFKPYIAAVTKDQVFVHSGADSRYYPFGTLEEGDLVRVVGEKSGWARIATAGAAFDGMYGYIKYPRSDSGRFKLEADKKTGVTLGMIDLIASNMNEGNAPEQSWKPLIKLPAATTVRVLDTTETDRETVHKVALTADASGWTNMIYLRAATDKEIAAWEAALGTTGRPIERPSSDTDVQPAKARPVEPAPEINPLPGVAGTNNNAPLDGTQQSDASAADAATTTAAEGDVEADFNAWHEKLLDLEEMYKSVSGGPLASAQVGPLREKYEQLSLEAGEEEPVISRFASRRVEQLSLWSDVQERKERLAAIRQRVAVATEDFDAAKLAIAMSGDYAAVGRIEASAVYNGHSLPELYRIQDVKSGRTVAYIKPDPEFKLAGLLGQLVGVAGEIEYDGSLRVNIVTPRHVDVLAPKK